MPVVRNPQYYFREGFCYSDINTTFLKCRIKLKTINDVKSMSLYSLTDRVPAFYFVCLINSNFISFYVDEFVNNTQTFQINDARQLPIIIPDKTTLDRFEQLFKQAIQIKKGESKEIALDNIQQEIDTLVKELYAI